MSLALELLARAALAHIHPVLLADPREQDNIHYAFGIVPKNLPKSIPAKALFARCSVFVEGFTDRMSGHCLILADRRNSELHSGAAALEAIDNSKWLPETYEVIEILLIHIGRTLIDLLGEHGAIAVEMLKDRRDSIRKEVQGKLAESRRGYDSLSLQEKDERHADADQTTTAWARENRLRLKSPCPACGNTAVISGEVVGRSPVRIDEDSGSIDREVRVLPNKLHCAFCRLMLSSFQELQEAERGTIYTVEEHEDPIEFFGIDPEEYIDVDEIIRRHADDQSGYDNE